MKDKSYYETLRDMLTEALPAYGSLKSYPNFINAYAVAMLADAVENAAKTVALAITGGSPQVEGRDDMWKESKGCVEKEPYTATGLCPVCGSGPMFVLLGILVDTLPVVRCIGCEWVGLARELKV